MDLVPELTLRLVVEVMPLWQATERSLAAAGVEPPFWAFAWAGGQAVARYLLDHPEQVAGRSVLDFATGSGLVALAAARAGAARVVAIDRDPLAVAATELNAERLGLVVEARCLDPLAAEGGPGSGGPPGERFDLVTAGDVCFDAAWAGRAIAFLRGHAALGALVLLGDPGRSYLPAAGLEPLARYPVRSSGDVDPVAGATGVVYRVRASDDSSGG